MNKTIIRAAIAVAMCLPAFAANAAVTVNFSFTGADDSDPGTVNGQLLFDATGFDVTPTSVKIFNPDISGTGEAVDLIPTAGDSFGSFDITGDQIVTRAEYFIQGFGSSALTRVSFNIDNYNAFEQRDLSGFVTSRLIFNNNHFSGVTYTPVITAVPEPATWAMMIGGFGVIGGAARHRRSKTTTAYA